MTIHIRPKSPLPPLFQRGEFLPLAKRGEEGFYLACLYNYGLTNKACRIRWETHGQLLKEVTPNDKSVGRD